MYLKGKGVEQNYRKAYSHFKTAADANNADALYYLGYMIENDMIVPERNRKGKALAIDYLN